MVSKSVASKAAERRAAAKRLAARPAPTFEAPARGTVLEAPGWDAAIDDQLADTYFRTRPAPGPTVPRRRAPLLVASVSLFTCVVGLWVVLGPLHHAASSMGWWRPTLPPEFVQTFDQPTVQPHVGVWLSTPGDIAQGCRIRYSEQHRVGTAGRGLMIDYDVDSTQPATTGVWVAVSYVPTRDDQDMVSLMVAGDPTSGYSQTCVLELQTAQGRSRYYLEGIGDAWRQVSIPLRAFAPPVRGAVQELRVLFEDWNVTQKQGRLYLDDVRLTSFGSEHRGWRVPPQRGSAVWGGVDSGAL